MHGWAIIVVNCTNEPFRSAVGEFLVSSNRGNVRLETLVNVPHTTPLTVETQPCPTSTPLYLLPVCLSFSLSLRGTHVPDTQPSASHLHTLLFNNEAFSTHPHTRGPYLALRSTHAPCPTMRPLFYSQTHSLSHSHTHNGHHLAMTAWDKGRQSKLLTNWRGHHIWQSARTDTNTHTNIEIDR